MTDALDRLERDIDLKVNFADSPMESEPSPLYVKSIWRPHPAVIPSKVTRRIAEFSRRIRAIFRRRPGKSNLLPLQHRLLAWLRKQTLYVIAMTNKGLGLFIVEYLRYAKDVLSHLTNQNVYQLLSK